jgi:hypothetical protein
MCIKLQEILTKKESKKFNNSSLITYILGNCNCKYCQDTDSQVQSIILIRSLTRKKINQDNLISRRLKSISDKEVDYRSKKWMPIIYNQMTDYKSAIDFITLKL